MENTLTQKVNKLWLTAPISVFLCCLLPEYIGPIVPFICFIIIIANKSKLQNKLFLGSMGKNIAVFIAFMLVGVTYSAYKVSALGSVVLWCYMFTAYYFVSNVVDSEEKLKKIILIVCISSGIAGVIAVGQIFLYHYGDSIIPGLKTFFNPFWHPLDAMLEKGVKLLPDSIVSNMSRTKFNRFPTRASSTFSNPLFYSTFGVMTLPFCAHCFLCSDNKKINVIGFICLLADLGGIACSYSRGPYMYAVIVLAALLLYGGKKAIKLCGFGAVSLLGIIVVARGTIKRLLSLDIKETSVNTRVGIWKAFFETAKQHPIFGLGTGFNNFREILHNQYGIKQPHAHNIIFQIMIENGIIGVILFALIFIGFLINIIKLAKKGKNERCYAVTLFASVLGFGICGMTDCLFYGFKPLQYIMIVLGIAQGAFAIWFKDDEFDLTEKLKSLKK